MGLDDVMDGSNRTKYDMTAPAKLKILKPAHARELSQLIAIYQQAIDPTEQKTAGEIATMVSDPRYVLMVSEQSGAVNGFAITIFPADADFFLLEYMAVAASGRGQRIGEALFQEAYRYGSTRGPATMVLEVDEPGKSFNHDNDTEARYRFYRRLGCRRIGSLGYILPLETGGSPPPMMLLAYQVPALMSVSPERLRHWLETIYVTVYQKSAVDPRIGSMMSSAGRSYAALPM